MTKDFFNPGYLSSNLKTLILNIIFPLSTPKLATNLTNFSFSRNRLNTLPWWQATYIIPFVFVLRISSYFLIRSAAFSGLSTIPACLLSYSISTISLLIRELTALFLFPFGWAASSSWRFKSLSTAINKK